MPRRGTVNARPAELYTWEPYGSVMISTARARLDGANVSDWQYEVWSSTHLTRPAPAGHLAPAWHIENPFTPPHPKPLLAHG